MKYDGNGARTQRHGPTLDLWLGYTRGFLALHLVFQELHNCSKEFGAVIRDIIRKPFVQIEVLSARCKSSDVKRERKRPNFQ